MTILPEMNEVNHFITLDAMRANDCHSTPKQSWSGALGIERRGAQQYLVNSDGV